VTRCYRKVIRITAEDSPNVQAGLKYEALGLPVPEEVIIPGVLPYHDYKKRLETWDPVRICIGLRGTFWEGAEVLLYPPEWLNLAELRAVQLLLDATPRRAVSIGCDPGEGGANTAWSVVDHLGLMEQVALRTPDTSVIVTRTLALIHSYGVKPENVVFDRGGGGKQIADELRSRGYGVRTVAFGEPANPEPRMGMFQFSEKIDIAEDKYTFVSKRAQMYGEFRSLLDPSLCGGPGKVFALPARYTDLRHQLSLFPLLYDKEGRMRLPPKNRVAGQGTRGEKSLVELIGRSPDESDSLVLAVYGMMRKARRPRAGVS
jgi:hypothetical protein